MEAMFEPAQLAPHSTDAEQALLGSILINPDAYFDVVLHLKSPEDFFLLHHAWIWEAMTRLANRQETIDFLTVIEELRHQERLEDVGGAAYITYLTSNVGTSIYADTYAQIIARAAVRRRLLDVSTRIAGLARQEDIDTNEVIDSSVGLVMSLVDQRSDPLVPADEALFQLFEDIEQLRTGEKNPKTIPTYTKLDKYLTGGGLEAGCWLVSSDTSGGKSLFKINVMLNQALGGNKVALFTMEMPKKAVFRRMIARLSSITVNDLAIGKIPAEKSDDYADACQLLSKHIHNIMIDDSQSISIFEIMSKIRRAKREFDIVCAYVDYAGLINDRGVEAERRDEIVGEFGRLLHGLGLALSLPIILGAQQNRGGGGKKGIAESYKLVQHAQGMFYIENSSEHQDKSSIEQKKKVWIEKQRDGRAGISEEFTFHLGYQSMGA